jgi:hypothetical protein
MLTEMTPRRPPSGAGSGEAPTIGATWRRSPYEARLARDIPGPTPLTSAAIAVDLRRRLPSNEDQFDLTLVNPRHMRQVPGRKTDVKDAEWIAQLLTYGLLSKSFVPKESIRDLRDMTRQRAQLVADKAAVVNRIHKTLESANIKLASVATDILGVLGRAMIQRIIHGVDDPERLANEARASLKKKVIPLRWALRGRVTQHHRVLLQLLIDQLRGLEGLIDRYTAQIEEMMGPHEEAERRLKTIPGVGAQAAEVFIAEIGPEGRGKPESPRDRAIRVIEQAPPLGISTRPNAIAGPAPALAPPPRGDSAIRGPTTPRKARGPPGSDLPPPPEARDHLTGDRPALGGRPAPT